MTAGERVSMRNFHQPIDERARSACHDVYRFERGVSQRTQRVAQGVTGLRSLNGVGNGGSQAGHGGGQRYRWRWWHCMGYMQRHWTVINAVGVSHGARQSCSGILFLRRRDGDGSGRLTARRARKLESRNDRQDELVVVRDVQVSNERVVVRDVHVEADVHATWVRCMLACWAGGLSASRAVTGPRASISGLAREAWPNGTRRLATKRHAHSLSSPPPPPAHIVEERSQRAVLCAPHSRRRRRRRPHRYPRRRHGHRALCHSRPGDEPSAAQARQGRLSIGRRLPHSLSSENTAATLPPQHAELPLPA